MANQFSLNYCHFHSFVCQANENKLSKLIGRFEEFPLVHESITSNAITSNAITSNALLVMTCW